MRILKILIKLILIGFCKKTAWRFFLDLVDVIQSYGCQLEPSIERFHGERCMSRDLTFHPIRTEVYFCVARVAHAWPHFIEKSFSLY